MKYLLIILILISFALVIGVVRKFLLNGKFTRIFSLKLLFKGVVLYTFLGLLALVYLIVLDENKLDELSQQEEERLTTTTQRIMNKIEAGQQQDIEQLYIKNTQKVETQLSEINLKVQRDNIEIIGYISYREEPSSNEIIMTSYVAPVLLNGYNLTDYRQGVTLSLNQNTININASTAHIEILEIRGEILEVTEDFYNGDYAYNSPQVIYLSVPSHIQIVDGENVFKIIN